MDQEIIKKISEYDYIAIYRHVNPDFDAFGSQLGMYDILKTTYPNKKVYVCGDFSSDLVDKYIQLAKENDILVYKNKKNQITFSVSGILDQDIDQATRVLKQIWQ